MLENINYNAFYEKYYEDCRPSIYLCKVQTQNNPSCMVTIVLDLIGGLTSRYPTCSQYRQQTIESFSSLQ